MTKNKTSLFNDFSAVTAQQWKQKIQFQLKGEDYNQNLVWESVEGIKVKPFYNKEDIIQENTISKPLQTWKITQAIYAGNGEIANKKALKAIKKGTDSILFTIPSKEIDAAILLKNIPLETTPVYFDIPFLSSKYLANFKQFEDTSKAGFYFNTDIIANLCKSGNWFDGLEKDFEEFSAIIAEHKNVVIDTTLYQNAGANITQQLAYTLAHVNEYLNVLDADKLSNFSFSFKIALGTNYFFEIAKIRALRLLWKTLASAYNIPTECKIVAFPTKRNKTLYDYNSNMLRTTTESMAAILGGADAICNMPYDAIYHKTNEFAERIARNQLLLLKEESYFDKTTNAADGAYYIESLTQQLAEKSLLLFKEIEKSGGFLKQLKDNTIQKKIKESDQKEQDLFDSEKEILVGSNKYQSNSDKMKSDLELFPFTKNKPRKTIIEPIIARRLSEDLEKKRLEEE